VKRNVIWDAMRDDGVPGKIVRLIKTYYEGMRAFVTENGEISKGLSINEGVRQSCDLPPILFSLFIDQIMKTLYKYSGGAISPTLSITDHDRADDVDILAETVTEAQLMIDDIAARSQATGLKIS